MKITPTQPPDTDQDAWTPADDALVYAWRLEQLLRLGIPRAFAEEFADRVDWHELERLVAHGCPPLLALEIVR
jgi:hypothetical protein